MSEFGSSGDFELQLKRKKYPVVMSALAQGDIIVRQFAALFLFCALTFSFIHLLTQIVSEKENKLIEGMKVMGMSNLSHWLHWVIAASVLQVIVINLVIVFGALFQYKIFTNCNYFVRHHVAISSMMIRSICSISGRSVLA